MASEMSKWYAELHRELTGEDSRTFAHRLRHAGIDLRTIAVLTGLSAPRALMLTSKAAAQNQRDYRRQWAREKRKQQKEQREMDNATLKAMFQALIDTLQDISDKLERLIQKGK